MNCPVCKKEMAQEDFGGVHTDVCKKGCKGIWFDWFELIKLDEKNEGVESLMQEALQHPRVNDGNRARINCPKCNLPLFQHKYQSSKEVNVDECYQCGGFFLDSGELQVIRDTYMSEAEEEAYFKKLVGEIPVIQKAERNLQKEKMRTDALRHYTRFLRLSYYATGR